MTDEVYNEVQRKMLKLEGLKTLERLIADKAIERTMRGNYKKLTSEL